MEWWRRRGVRRRGSERAAEAASIRPIAFAKLAGLAYDGDIWMASPSRRSGRSDAPAMFR